MKKVNIVVVNDEFRFKIKNMSMNAGKKGMSILTITNSTRLHNINIYCHERILLQNSKRPISKKKLESFPDWKKWKKKKSKNFSEVLLCLETQGFEFRMIWYILTAFGSLVSYSVLRFG